MEKNIFNCLKMAIKAIKENKNRDKERGLCRRNHIRRGNAVRQKGVFVYKPHPDGQFGSSLRRKKLTRGTVWYVLGVKFRFAEKFISTGGGQLKAEVFSFATGGVRSCFQVENSLNGQRRSTGKAATKKERTWTAKTAEFRRQKEPTGTYWLRNKEGLTTLSYSANNQLIKIFTLGSRETRLAETKVKFPQIACNRDVKNFGLIAKGVFSQTERHL